MLHQGEPDEVGTWRIREPWRSFLEGSFELPRDPEAEHRRAVDEARAQATRREERLARKAGEEEAAAGAEAQRQERLRRRAQLQELAAARRQAGATTEGEEPVVDG